MQTLAEMVMSDASCSGDHRHMLKPVLKCGSEDELSNDLDYEESRPNDLCHADTLQRWCRQMLLAADVTAACRSQC